VIVLVEVKSDGRLQAQAILRLLQPELIATIVPPEVDLESSSERHQEIDEVEIYGEVGAQSLTLWTIAGRQVQVYPETEIKGDITVGDRVKVHAFYSADGILIAREIEMDTAITEDQNREDSEEFDTGNHSGDDHSGDDHSGDDHSGDDHSGDDHSGEGDSSMQEDDHSGSSEAKNDGESSIDSSDDDHSGSGSGEDSEDGGKGGDDGESGDHEDSGESTSFELQPWLVNPLPSNI
jgi:hypothetical protein